jgi:soluble lytic murein transglycosylase-like protein
MTSQDISNLIIQTATAYGVDPRLVLEVGMKESNLNQDAVSPAGAIGIMQLMPATAAALGVHPHDPADNIKGGTILLSQLLSEFSGSVAEALGSYDWHPDAVKAAVAAHGTAWLYYAPAETQDYVQTILANMGSEYSVSVGIPVYPIPGLDSTAVDQSSVLPTSNFSLGTVLWLGAAGLAAWILVELLQ